MKRKEEVKTILVAFIIFILFLVVSYFSKVYENSIKNFIGENIFGMIIYVMLINLDVVFAPISVIPLIPIATSIWGWPIAGFLTLIGWTIGSIIVFLITRRYGVPIIKKMISIEDVWRIQKAIPEKNIFLGIVLIRIFLPIDVMSYAISLFTKISLKKYILATVIGFSFISFILAYLGEFNLKAQLILGLIGFSLMLLMLVILIFDKKIRERLIEELKKTFKD